MDAAVRQHRDTTTTTSPTSSSSSIAAAALERLRRIGRQPKEHPPHRDLARRASVLVPLFLARTTDDNTSDNGNATAQLHVLLTQRPTALRAHGGEVCFPGGKQDAEDGGDDVATALREAREEVGLASDRVRPLCLLETLESSGGLAVTPVVGWVEPAQAAEPSQLALNADEVEAAFAVPLAYFGNDANLSEPKRTIAWRGGTFEMRTYLYRDAPSGRTFKIWGLTAYIAHRVSQICFSSKDVPQTTRIKADSNQQGAEEAKEQSAKKLSGYLFRKQDAIGSSRKQYWMKRYFVLEGNMLHQYDGERQAARRSASATKKDRLPLMEVDVAICSDQECAAATTAGEGCCFAFAVSALSGRVEWHLAARTSEERTRWTTELAHLR